MNCPLAATAAFLLSVSVLFADSAFVVRALVEPEQETYYTGQTIRLVLEFEAHDEEVGGVNVGGLPDEFWAQSQQTEFVELAGSSEPREGTLVNIRRFAVDYILLKSGDHSFQPRATAMLSRRMQRGGGNSLFGTFIQSHQTAARANAVSLHVVPLPANAPSDACGLVGAFALQASLDPAEASPGDLVNLRWSLHGIGNLADFQPPPTIPADGFKVYDAKCEVDTTNDLLRVSQVYVPQSLASTNVPAFSVSFFNPVKGAYETLSAGPFALRLRERVAETIEDFPVGSSSNVSETAASPPPVPAAGDAAVFVLTASVNGKLAPSSESLTLRNLPVGATVRVLERSARWMRVEADGSSVWIPAP